MNAEPNLCAWWLPAESPRWGSGEIRLWSAPPFLDGAARREMFATLDKSEKARASQFRFLEECSNFIAARARDAGEASDKRRPGVSCRTAESTGNRWRLETIQNARANCGR